MAGLGEVFATASGWLKLIELALTFITLLIHRSVGLSDVCVNVRCYK